MDETPNGQKKPDQGQKPKRRKKFGWNSPEHNPEEFRLSLVEHLDELRTRVFRSFIIVLAFWAVCWVNFEYIYAFLTIRAVNAVKAGLPKGSKFSEIFLHAADPFMIMMKISFFCALILAFPFLVLQLWAFIAPGLKPNEQKPLRQVGPVSLFLFLLGGFFCWLILPGAFTWFASYLVSFHSADLNQEAGTMAMFSLKAILAFGIGFQLPLVVFILGALNLLSAETLVKYWRHAAVAIFVIAGAITPSNDPITMLMMAIPLTVMFAISAYAVKVTQAKKKRNIEVIIESEPATQYEAPKALTSEESDSTDVNA